MTTRIRLRRMGANKRPFYRVVVADQRAPRDGRFIEAIGKYHPLSDPSLIEIDEERAMHWLRVGAQPSNQVRNLMSKIGIWEKFVTERPSAAASVKPAKERPAKEKRSKKALAKAAETAPVPVPEAAAEVPVSEPDDAGAAGDGTPDAEAAQPAAPSEASPEAAGSAKPEGAEPEGDGEA